MSFLPRLLIFLSLGWVIWAPSFAQSLPPWESEAFWFGWEPINDTLTRCGTVDLSILPRPGYTSVGPYSVLLYRAGQAPYKFNMGAGPTYRWTVNLKAGGPYLLSMDDSTGATGGVSRPFNVLPGSASCSASGEIPQTLAVSLLTTAAASCDTVSFEVNGGTAPYTLTVTAAGLNTKTVVFATGRFDYVLDLPAGADAVLSVEDSAGRGSVGQVFKVAQGSSTSCLTAAPTLLQAKPTTTYPGVISSVVPASGLVSGSLTSGVQTSASSSPTSGSSTAKESNGPSIPVVVGGVIGGFAVLLFLLLLIIYLRTRRGQQHSEQRENKRQTEARLNAPPISSTLSPSSPHPSTMTDMRSSVISASPFQSEPMRFGPAPVVMGPPRDTINYRVPNDFGPAPVVMEPPRDTINYRVPSDLIHPSQQYPSQAQASMHPYANQIISQAGSTIPSQYPSTAYMPASSSRPYSPPPTASKEERHFSWLSGVSRSNAATNDRTRSPPPQYGRRG